MREVNLLIRKIRISKQQKIESHVVLTNRNNFDQWDIKCLLLLLLLL